MRSAIINHEVNKETWRIDILEDASVITPLSSVPTKNDLTIAETITKQQEDVLSVVNKLDIKPDQGREDEDDEGHQIRILPPRGKLTKRIAELRQGLGSKSL